MMSLAIDLLQEPLAICRLGSAAAIPVWAVARSFFSIIRTGDELSIICHESQVPADVDGSRGWRAFRLRGPFDLGAVGIMLSVAAPLAAAGVSIMPLATYDTDYVLVRTTQLRVAIGALRAAGHAVHHST